MKYTKFLFLSLLIWSCSPPTENTSKQGIMSPENIPTSTDTPDKRVTLKKTNAQKNTMRGTFMYVADSSVFIECDTGNK